MDFLNIRYVKLQFVLRLLGEAKLPAYKVSMIRGGIGEMLMQQHCINGRLCDKEGVCEYAQECIVQRIMYASPKEQLAFMQRGNSVGYVIECGNHQTDFNKDNLLTFHLLIFGKNIVYFNEYTQAIHLLGMQGLGKDKIKYKIEGIFNQKGEAILSGNDILLNRYQPEKVYDYAIRRRKELWQSGNSFQVRLKTPLSIKYRGELIRELQEEPLKESLMRRIAILNSFEELEECVPEIESRFPVIAYQKTRWQEIPRFSFRNQEKIWLKGLIGDFLIENVSEDWLLLLCAGELVHIGKSVTFGFGQYILQEVGSNHELR